jgi:hypothetical protein
MRPVRAALSLRFNHPVKLFAIGKRVSIEFFWASKWKGGLVNSGCGKLLDAPTPVSDVQLKELGIAVKKTAGQ